MLTWTGADQHAVGVTFSLGLQAEKADREPGSSGSRRPAPAISGKVRVTKHKLVGTGAPMPALRKDQPSALAAELTRHRPKTRWRQHGSLALDSRAESSERVHALRRDTTLIEWAYEVGFEGLSGAPNAFQRNLIAKSWTCRGNGNGRSTAGERSA